LKHKQQFNALQESLYQILSKRTSSKPEDTDDIIRIVNELVDFEKKIAKDSETFEEMDKILRGKQTNLVGAGNNGNSDGGKDCGRLLFEKIVSHFMSLFDVPKADSVLPAMNRVYSRYNELINFYRALLQEMRLESDCSTTRTLTAVKHKFGSEKWKPGNPGGASLAAQAHREIFNFDSDEDHDPAAHPQQHGHSNVVSTTNTKVNKLTERRRSGNNNNNSLKANKHEIAAVDMDSESDHRHLVDCLSSDGDEW